MGNNLLTVEEVAAVLGISTGMVATNERAGTLGFARFGDRYMSTHSVAMALREDKGFLEKQREANAIVLNADANMALQVEREANAKRALAKQASDAAAHERWLARTAIEQRNRKAYDDAINPPHAPRNVVGAVVQPEAR
jgi:hypothetical protein